MDKKEIKNQTNLNEIPEYDYYDKPEEVMPSMDYFKQPINNHLDNDPNKITNNHENDKELLIKELSENLNIDFLANNNNTNKNKGEGSKKPLTTIQGVSDESVSNINFRHENDVKKEENKIEMCTDSIIEKVYDDENNLMSFYGGNNDIESIVNNLQYSVNMKQDISILVEDYLNVIEFDKINLEQINKIIQNVNPNDLKDGKKFIEKLDYDGNVISKISDINYLLFKAKDIDNKDMEYFKKKIKEKSNILFAWRDIMPGPDSFFRAIMFSFLEEIILSRNINFYRNFLYELYKNIENNYFKKILSYYQIDCLKTKIYLILIYYAMTIQDVEQSIQTAHSLFIKIYNYDTNFDLLLILNLKFLIYKYLKENEKKLYTREYSVRMGTLLPSKYKMKNGKFNFKAFYENNLLQLNHDIEKITVSVIPFILRRDLYLYSFEGKKINHVWVHTEDKENQGFIPFRLFILNGCYEIIYPKDYYNQFEKTFSNFSSINNNKVISKNITNENIQNEKILEDIDDDEDEEEKIKTSTNLLNEYMNNNNNLNNKDNNTNKNILNDNNNNITKQNNNIQSNEIGKDTVYKLNMNNRNNNLPNDINIIKQNINNNLNKNNTNENLNNNNNNLNINNKDNQNINNNINININLNDNNLNNNNLDNNKNNMIHNDINNKMSNNLMINNINNLNCNSNNNNNYNNYNTNNNNYNINNNYNNYINYYTSYNSNTSIKSSRKTKNEIIKNNPQKNNLEIFIENPLDKPDNLKINMRTRSYSNVQPIISFNQQNDNNIKNSSYYIKTQPLNRAYSISTHKQCPLCKKPVINNNICEKCYLNHLITFVQNSYIQFIKKNITNIINNRPKDNLTIFFANLTIFFPNRTSKSFSESYFLLSDNDKNIFNEKLNNFKSSLCLGCFNFINKENNFTYLNESVPEGKNIFLFRFPCGCIFCSPDCLNRFINHVPIKKINSFICGCGVEYDYIKLKFLLYFALSHNLINFKNEILRYMYEIIKDKCCKCKKIIVLNQDKKNNVNIMELKDQEAEKIFGINKFNHLICDECAKSKEIPKNKFCCYLCLSEHIIINKQNINNCQIRNTCSIF